MNRLALASLFTLAACVGGTADKPLTAPSELKVSQLGVGLHVSWKDNSSDEDEFQIERKSTGGFAMIASVVFDITQFHDEPVTFDTAYTYRVRAMKGNVPSAYTSPVTGTAMGAANQPPSCTIVAPDAGTTVPFDQAVTFTASATDPEDGALSGASVVWTSNLVTPPLGSGLTLTRTLPIPGVHTVTCRATDSQGLTGTSSMIVTAVSPVARINHPSNGETRAAANDIPFIGDGRDFEDGALPDAGLVWTSNLDGVIGTGRTLNRRLSAGTNIVTLTVTDSDGGTGAQSISLTITP